jgi:hypothetical protein
VSDTLYLSTEALSDLVCYQRETIRDLKSKIARAKDRAEILTAPKQAIGGEETRKVPTRLLNEILEELS